MTTIYIDFETYYDRDYSLSKMSSEEYIRDARVSDAAQVYDNTQIYGDEKLNTNA
jgi:hypothetical protein